MDLEQIILLISIIIISILLILFLVAFYATRAVFSLRSDGSTKLKYRNNDYYKDIKSKKINIKSNKNQTLGGYLYNNITNKVTEELKLAIEKDYVNKFWTGCKG